MSKSHSLGVSPAQRVSERPYSASQRWRETDPEVCLYQQLAAFNTPHGEVFGDLGGTECAATATSRGSRLSDEGGAGGGVLQAAAIPTTLCKRENKGALLGGIIRLSAGSRTNSASPLGPELATATERGELKLLAGSQRPPPPWSRPGPHRANLLLCLSSCLGPV